MDLDELSELAKAGAEAEAEMRLFQKIQAEYQPMQPVEAELAPNPVTKELKDIAQDMAEYHSEYNENRRADEVKAEKDEKHSFRYDLLVAAFTVALPLFFEHLHDIAEFSLEFFRSLP